MVLASVILPHPHGADLRSAPEPHRCRRSRFTISRRSAHSSASSFDFANAFLFSVSPSLTPFLRL